MIVTDRWKVPTGRRQYVATEKGLPEPDWQGFEGKEYAYWALADRIRDEFGDQPATIGEIYEEVTSQLGLSSSDTITLVQAAKAQGYLK